MPTPEPAKEGTYLLDKPRPGDSIHPIDLRELFNLLFFQTTRNDSPHDWKPVRDEFKLSPPVDHVCPHCKELIHSEITGTLRCQFCGETAHPPVFSGYGHGNFIEDTEKKCAEIDNDPGSIESECIQYGRKITTARNEYIRKKQRKADLNRFINSIKY